MNYFIDIGNDYTYSTSGDGTSATPWSFYQLEDFIVSGSPGSENSVGSYVHISANDILNIKGTWFPASNVNLLEDSAHFSAATLQAWDVENNGFWGFVVSGIYDIINFGNYDFKTNVVIKDFYTNKYHSEVTTYNNTTSGSIFTYKNSIFYNNFTHFMFGELNFYGCIFNDIIDITIDSYAYPYSPSISATFIDCSFVGSKIIDHAINSGTFYVSACTFSGTSATTLGGITASTLISSNNIFNKSPLGLFPIMDLINDKGSMSYANTNLPFVKRESNWSNLGITDGGFGSLRKGYGAYYFDEVYIDLDQSWDNGLGIPGNPYSWTDFQDYNKIVYSGDILHFKGVKQISEFNVPACSADTILDTLTIDYWNVDPYIAPFQVSATNSSLGNKTLNCNIKNGILYCGSVNVSACSAATFEDFFVSATGLIENINSNIVSNGCTFVSPISGIELIATGRGESSWIFKDSILDVNKINGDVSSGNSVSAISCVFTSSDNSSVSGTNIQTFYDDGGCQFSWNRLYNWPGFDSVQDDWKYSHLGAGITISGTGDWNV